MQPRLRTILWRELPPCVRRNYVWGARQWHHFQLTLARLHRALRQSPTWNFVAIFGTLGMGLTLLLLLAPPQPRAETGVDRRHVSTNDRQVGLDSRLELREQPAPRERPYEVVLGESRQAFKAIAELAPDDSPPRFRRRRSDTAQRPLNPLLMPEPTPVAEAPSERDPFDEPSPRSPNNPPPPPRLGLDVSLLRSSPEPEFSWTARTVPPLRRGTRRMGEWEDAWRPFVATLEEPQTERSLTMTVLSDEERVVSHWDPLPPPETAPPSVEIGLELWIGGERRTTKQSPPLQLHLLNVGTDAVPRIDVVDGPLPESDFTTPLSLPHRNVSGLSPGKEDLIPLSLRSPGRKVVSVLVTAFVGTENLQTIESPSRSSAPPPRQRAPARAESPHLTLTTRPAEKLSSFRLFSIPIQVVNDGTTVLEDVVIVAEIPSSLTHHYGQTVHYRFGTLRPNETRATRLLLSPREAGTARVSLSVFDGKRTATDDGEAVVEIDPDWLSEKEPETITTEDISWTKTRERQDASF